MKDNASSWKSQTYPDPTPLSLQQEENICVRAITITMFHVLSAHTLPRAAAGLLAASLSPLARCPRPRHWQGRGRTCTGPPWRGRGRAACSISLPICSVTNNCEAQARVRQGQDRTLKLVATRHHHHPQIEFYLTNGQVR